MRAICRHRSEMLEAVNRFCDQVGSDFEHPYQITIRRFKRDRTLDQNAKLHAMIRTLAEHCGYTESAMKDVLKVQFAPIVVSTIPGLGEVERPKGTADMNVEEMSEFMERIYQLGAELGVTFYGD